MNAWAALPKLLYYFDQVFMSQVTSPRELNIWANVTSHTRVWTLAENFKKISPQEDLLKLSEHLP